MEVSRSFEEFVGTSLPALSRYARALTRDRHAAEDLIQDTLVKVARAWRRIRAEDNPLGYATTTMFRTYLSAWRVRQRYSQPLSLQDEPIVDSRGYDRAEDRLMLRAALDGLPPLQRAVLVATYLDDAPDEVIARMVGRAPATVRSLRRRGLATLRAALGVTGEVREGITHG